jgi:CHAT domain-containing protein/tetratricopeptide (TPR) repeat protein
MASTMLPRLSISPESPPCTQTPPPTKVGSRSGCTWLRVGRIAAIGARSTRALRDQVNPQAMHAAALSELLIGSGEGKSLERSISYLQIASRLDGQPGPVLADLAAAYLVRAERAHTPRDLLAAIEAAEEALEREPRNRAALFNRALALQRFGLVEEAARGWRDYLAADSASVWADEARQNLRETLAVDVPPPPPGPDAPVSAYTAYAAADPQGARVLGWCSVLGAWAEATLQSRGAHAEEHLQRAEALAAALERHSGADATLDDGARAIRARSGGRGLLRLARAHREFAAGCRLEHRVDFRAAAQHFSAATADAGDSPVLRGWARLLYGDMVFHTGDAVQGEAIAREIAAWVDPARHTAMAARARHVLTTVLLRGDRYVAGLEQARQAAGLYARAGERENEGVSLDYMAIAQFHLRDMDQGYTLEHQALERLKADRGSYRLHNLLAHAAQIVGNDGFTRAAGRIADEGVGVAEQTGNPVFVAESRLLRARLRATAGAFRSAGEDVAAGQAAMARIAYPRAREWMIAQRQMTEAVTTLRARPARAAEALDSAAAYLMEKMNAPLVAFPAVVGGAQARLAAGDTARATARLEAALALLEQRRDSIRMEPRRAAVFEAARGVVDRVAMLKLAAGDTIEALGYLDRGRASLAPVGSAQRTGTADADRVVAGPPGEVALEYALVGDTLLAWTVAGRRVELFRTVVDPVRLAHFAENLRQQFERSAGEAELRPGLSRLYEWLIRPVEDRLGEAGMPLVIVADGALSSVPFAALYDVRRRRYLVEDHPLRFAASLREARREAVRGGGAEAAVFVSDPAFNPAEHPGFRPLIGATDEVAEIAAEYPGAQVLSGADANGRALLAVLGRARMVHYAGHAVFDDERPERSYLLLAPSPRRNATAKLEAGEIAELDLRHLSLVVLSACQTVRTGEGRAAGFSGLAGAFLAAGARGAVGSLWEVDDRLTRRLMTAFHRAYRGSGNGPEALRAAQLHLLRSGEPALRSPAAWAGFRYAGR